MARNNDFRYHREIIENFRILNLNNRICIYAFRNLVRSQIRILENTIRTSTDIYEITDCRLRKIIFENIEVWLSLIIEIRFTP